MTYVHFYCLFWVSLEKDENISHYSLISTFSVSTFSTFSHFYILSVLFLYCQGFYSLSLVCNHSYVFHTLSMVEFKGLNVSLMLLTLLLLKVLSILWQSDLWELYLIWSHDMTPGWQIFTAFRLFCINYLKYGTFAFVLHLGHSCQGFCFSWSF